LLRDTHILGAALKFVPPVEPRSNMQLLFMAYTERPGLSSVRLQRLHHCDTDRLCIYMNHGDWARREMKSRLRLRLRLNEHSIVE